MPLELYTFLVKLAYWDEPERAPHLRDVHCCCLYVCIYIYIYMYVSYVMPEIPVAGDKMATILKRQEYSLQVPTPV